jgi:hypothetical protein
MTTKRLLAAVVLVFACITASTATTALASSRPAVSGFSFSPSTFSVAPAGAAAAASRPATTIRFRLSKPATVTIAIARKVTGRKVGHRCVKSSARLRSRPACARYVLEGTISRAVRKSGQGALAFSGRLRGHALVSGSYRATIRATDRGRRRSARRTARFTVSRRSSAPSAPSPAPAPAPSAPSGGFPNPSTTGVPAGWVPAETRSSDLVVTTPGAVVQDVRLLNADIVVQAPNVTIRRVDLQGGRINNWEGPSCSNGLVVEDSTFEPPPGQQFSDDTEGATGVGGYTARRVKIWRREEGFRDGGKGGGCGPVTIQDSFAKISIPPGCPGDPHSDGIQGYDGPPLTVTNTTIDFTEAACGTAPFFVPKNQSNTTATVNGLLVMGGGYPFRMGVPGTVSNLNIVNRSWGYGPIDVACSVVSSWSANIVTTTPDYQIASVVRPQPCNSNGGG